MYRVGIIGFGKMGMLHGALLSGSNKAKIIAICDKSAVMRFGFKRVYKNVNIYSDAKKMLEKENLDIVVVTTPTFNHMESIDLAINKGCAVFVEKPLAINTEQAKRIVDCSEKNKTFIQVGFCNRFYPSFEKAKYMLKNNELGMIKDVKAEMYIADVFEEHTGWRYKPELSGGGALMDFGIHMLDLIIHFFGKIDTIDANTKRLYSKLVEDEATAEIVFTSGVNCHFETSWSKEEYRKSYSRIEIHGDKKTMIVTDQTLDILDIDGNKLESYAYPQLYTGSFIDIGGLLYSKQIDSFLKCVEDNEKCNEIKGCTPEQALYVQQVVEAIYKSSKEKRKIRIGKNGEN